MEENTENIQNENIDTENENVTANETPEATKENTQENNYFESIDNAKSVLKELEDYNKKPENENTYTYDEELEQWVDKEGKLYDEKPQTEQTNKYNPYDWELKKTAQQIENAKQNTVKSMERECVDSFEKGFAEYKDILSEKQWEVLKHDIVTPSMNKFADKIYNETYDANTIKEIKADIQDSIVSHISILNLKQQSQNIVNEKQKNDFPLENNTTSNVQGSVKNTTFEGKSRNDINNILQKIAQKYSNK